MRALSILAMVVAAIVAAGCITVVRGPTAPPARTPEVTHAPTPAPTAEPTPPPTLEPTPSLAPGQTPLPTPMDLRPFLTAGVTLYNLGDATLYATATGIDPDSGDEFKLGTFQVEPEQFTRQAAIPLRIRFDFSFSADSPDAAGTCTMVVNNGDEVDFVAVSSGVVVTRNGVQPNNVAEMALTTSPLCLAGSTP